MTKRFNKKKYAIPFGKFSSSDHSEFPANEFLVGREGSSRAELIEFLIETGSQGSFLVTGRRGVGKTSFVEYCLREYERSIYKRFLRSNIGRSFSELILLALLTIAAVFLVLCYSQLAPIIVYNLKSNPLLIILLSPVLITVYWLCISSRNIFLILIKNLKKNLLPPGFISVLLVISFLSFFLYFPVNSAPSSIISRLLLLICNVYIIFQVPYLEKTWNFCSKFFNFLSYLITLIGIVWFIILCTKLIIPIQLLLLFESLIYQNIFDFLNDEFSVYTHILLSTQLILIGFTVRLGDLISKIYFTRQSKPEVKEGIIKGIHWILFFILLAILFLFCSQFVFNNNNKIVVYQNYFSFIFVFIYISTAYLVNNDFKKNIEDGKTRKNSTHTSAFKIKFLTSIAYFKKVLTSIADCKPEAILCLKAFSFLIIAFQLALPLLSELFTSYDLSDYFAIKDKILGNKMINGSEQFNWIFMVTILLFSICFIEYEWIIRPRIIAREDFALSPGARTRWTDFSMTKNATDKNNKTSPDDRACNKRYNLELERLTFPYLTYSTLMPTLITTINLGFDSLDQKKVIQAMLVGLRQKYFMVFLSWRSVRANIKRFVNLNGLLVIVLVMSNVFFYVPEKIDNDDAATEKLKETEKSISITSALKFKSSVVTKYSPIHKVEPEDNYCLHIKSFDNLKYPSLIPSLLCRLSNDFGNIAVPILYYELLPVSIQTVKELEQELDQLLFYVFDINRSFSPKLNKGDINTNTLSFRVFHFLLFFW